MCSENGMKLRVGSSGKNETKVQGKAIVDVYGSKFVIPLYFEILDSAILHYQAGLGNRLCYEISFNDYDQVIYSANSENAAGQKTTPDAKYEVFNTSLEYKIVLIQIWLEESRWSIKIWLSCTIEL